MKGRYQNQCARRVSGITSSGTLKAKIFESQII